jgi:hypothetical protein
MRSEQERRRSTEYNIHSYVDLMGEKGNTYSILVTRNQKERDNCEDLDICGKVY